MSDWNTQIIEEFRANAGKVGGNFEGAPMILITTVGRKSGRERVTPLVYQPVGDDIAIFGSKAGAPTHPDWYRNIVANPTITIEVGAEKVTAEARILEGDERDSIWERQKQLMPGFAEYEATADGRVIPVVLLHRVA
jgi:deazaflavin-dependent oxidoreductase (nitroreductase family)